MTELAPLRSRSFASSGRVGAIPVRAITSRIRFRTLFCFGVMARFDFLLKAPLLLTVVRDASLDSVPKMLLRWF